MDEQQKDNQDLVVGNDGSMNQGSGESTQEKPVNNIEIKVEESNSEPAVNEATPPPEETVKNEENDITPNEEESVEEAVSFIAGGQAADGVKEENESTENAEESTTDSNDDVVKAPDNEDVVSDSGENTGIVTESIVTETVEEAADNNEVSPANDIPAAIMPTQEGMSNNEQNKPHEHRNNKKLTVIVTVFVAVMLSGAAVFAFLSAQSNTEETTPESSSQTSEAENLPTNEVSPASQSDVDSTINELDETIDSLDSSELGEDTITDETLGL